MPESHPETKPWVIEKIQNLKAMRIIDVGAGAGIYSELVLKDSEGVSIDAIEIWGPYIEEFRLEEKYDQVFQVDVRSFASFDYDLVILGDVLEHMSLSDAKALWNRISKSARYAIITIPIVHYPQGEEHGNPYEIHVTDNWRTKDVLRTFHSIVDFAEFEVTGAFVADFGRFSRSRIGRELQKLRLQKQIS